MKFKHLFFTLALIQAATVWSQTVEDVLRYSITDITGSARYKSMGGAFGALGGDLSSLNSNPAGSAVFSSSQFAVTGFYGRNATENSYGTAIRESTDDDIDINQIGAVFVDRSGNGRGITKFALAVNYEETRNFDNDFEASGFTLDGLDTYFLGFAQGVPLGALERQSRFIEDDYLDIGAIQGFQDQQAFLGLASGFIRPVNPNDPNNTQYESNAIYGNVSQFISSFNQGEVSKLTLNGAIEVDSRLYLGASINGHWITRDQTTQITESGYSPTSPISDASDTYLDNRINVEGTGVSAQAGFIYKMGQVVRIGASYQTPTWYWIRENTGQRVFTPLADPDIEFINFDIVNVYPEYRMRTPGAATVSGALVLGKVALLSGDATYRDYSTSQLGRKNEAFFQGENDFIKEFLGQSWEYRLGFEYRIEETVSVRAGYRSLDGPFTDSPEGDLTEYSGGLGIKISPNGRLDLAVSTMDITNTIFPIEVGYPNNSIGQDSQRTLVSLSYIANF